MATGLKILSMMMSFLIVSISEITPWVFSNENAADNSVILDAACFDSVCSIPSETILSVENVFVSETPAADIAEPVTEILSEETTFVFEEPVTEIVTETVIKEEVVTEPETVTELETVTEEEEPETEDSAKETEAPKAAASESKKAKESSDKMLWPVALKSEVVAGYPAYDSGRAHHGIDIFVIGSDGRTRDDNGNSLSYGEPFRAAQSGVVVEVRNNGEWNTGFGNYCIVDHGDGTQTLYAHAKTIYVKLGETVSQGQTLGEIGGTGNTTAPHLHFEVRVGNTQSYSRVNPLNYVSEP